MISMWLLEIFLNELGELRQSDKDTTPEYKQLQDNFRQLLSADRVKVSHVSAAAGQLPPAAQRRPGQGQSCLAVNTHSGHVRRESVLTLTPHTHISR